MTKRTKIAVTILVTMTIYMGYTIYDMYDKLALVTIHVEGDKSMVTEKSVTMTDSHGDKFHRMTDNDGFADFGYMLKGVYVISIEDIPICDGFKLSVYLTQHVESFKVGIINNTYCIIYGN